ncbi:hypothetical protein [Leifsonia shinshuensis]|uniref:hypothetical protein n=1 Tax=Leifsonia shinshuensis TaxID=150026 RepID=UPI00285CA168|nr:hypothetical protein [Leifsonia shinshuensis]MDR6971319.1 hypothetical protein [Leifsonia shinshuensis]
MKKTPGIVAAALALLMSGGSAMAAGATEPTAVVAADTHDAVAFTSPAPGSRVTERTPEFRGTGKPGASVVVTGLNGVVLCAARVTADGWACTSVVPIGDGTAWAIATQDAWAVKTSASLSFEVDYEPRPAVPAWVFPLGGAALIILVVGGGILLASWRRKRGDEQDHGEPAVDAATEADENESTADAQTGTETDTETDTEADAETEAEAERVTAE